MTKVFNKVLYANTVKNSVSVILILFMFFLSGCSGEEETPPQVASVKLDDSTLSELNISDSIDGAITLSVNENNSTGISLVSKDNTLEDAIYTISGIDSENFEINTTTGVVTFIGDSAQIDGNNSYTFILTTNDGVNDINETIIINIEDTNVTVDQTDETDEPEVQVPVVIGNIPVISSDIPSYNYVSENQTSALTISATDEDNDTLSYSVSGSDADYFTVNSITGVMTFKETADYERKAMHYITAVASDGINIGTAQIIIIVTNEEEVPVITGFTASIDENVEIGTVVGTIVVEDSGDVVSTTSATFTLSDTTNFSVNSSGQITTNSPIDYETTPIHNLTAYSTNMVGNSSDVNVTININNINDNAPIITSMTDVTVNENELTAVELNAVDLDGNILTYSLSGTDASSFIVTNTGVVSFNTAPDYESGKTSYLFIATVDDGLYDVNQSIIINIENVNEFFPSAPSTIVVNVNENQTEAITLSATDADYNDTLTYSISGTDASYFDLDSSSGLVTFKTTSDYETKQSYTFLATINDGLHDIYQGVTINLNNVNDNLPVFTSDIPTYVYVSENQTAVATLSATDDDNDTLSYGVSGSEADYFSVNSSTGIITFKDPTDYERKAMHYIRVNVSDVEHNVSAQKIIIVTNTEEVPVIENFTASIDENLSIGTIVGTISMTDVGDSLSVGTSMAFTLSDTTSFSIDNAGQITTNSNIDYENITSHSLSAYATNNVGDSTDVNVTININNLNDNIPAFENTTASVSENQTDAISLNVTDADNDSLTYTLSGTDANSFSVDSNGVVTFNSAPDYEVKQLYTFSVTANDGLHDVLETITINITNINEFAPIITNSATVSINENQTDAITIVATDADYNDTLTYSISGTDVSYFNIDSSNGVVTFKTTSDYESGKISYSFTAAVNDGSLSDTQAITINLNNVNDNLPVITNEPLNFGVLYPTALENQTSVATITATDADNDTLTYSLSGTDISFFSINSASGVITFKTAPDYENSKSTYVLTATVNDELNNVNLEIRVSIGNLEEPPVIENFTASIDENATTGTIIGSISVVEDGDSPITSYTLSDTTNFSIDSAGQITTASALDYETTASYSLTVYASNTDFNSADANITINLNNLNDNSPVFTNTTASVSENQTDAISLNVTDADNDSLTYTLSGTDASSFSADSNGVVTFNSAPDYEVKQSYSFSVTANDGLNDVVEAITVNVVNVNEYDPVITNSATFNITEGQEDFVTLTATDADFNTTLIYSISDGNSSSFTIDSSTGVATFNTNPDYESGNIVYTFTHTVSDGERSAPPQTVTINILNDNDNHPVITNDPNPNVYVIYLTVPENQIDVITITATDVDNDVLVFSLDPLSSDLALFDINSSTGVITFLTPPDYETSSSYSITAVVDDGRTQDTLALVISIGDVAEAPVLENFTSNLDENATIGAVVGDINVSDSGDSTIASFTLNDTTNFSIDTSGQITTSTAFDYESITSYSLSVYATYTSSATPSDVNETSAVNVTIDVDNIGDFYIKSAVYDDNRTTAVDDDKLYLYFDQSIDSTTIAVDSSYIIGGTGSIDVNSISDYNDSLFHRNTISMASGSTAFVVNDTNITIAQTGITDDYAPSIAQFTQVDNAVVTVSEYKPVLKTGQTASYTANDDGTYQAGMARDYTDNSDGTITNSSTGLIWQKEDDNTTRNLADADTYCTTTLTLPGSGWRLPTIEELMQLSDKGLQDPAIDPLFTNTDSMSYWSSTVYSNNTSNNWSVSFSSGLDSNDADTVTNYVRCVR